MGTVKTRRHNTSIENRMEWNNVVHVIGCLQLSTMHFYKVIKVTIPVYRPKSLFMDIAKRFRAIGKADLRCTKYRNTSMRRIRFIAGELTYLYELCTKPKDHYKVFLYDWVICMFNRLCVCTVHIIFTQILCVCGCYIFICGHAKIT